MERPFAAARRAAGLDIHRASVRLGISESHLRALEKSRAPLTQRVATKMAREYGVSLQQLFSRPIT